MENSSEVSRSESAVQDEAINFKNLLAKFLAFLPFFIFSLIITFSVAYLMVRYAKPRYALRSTILIKDKGRGSFDGAESFISGSSLLVQSKNLENEIGIMKSRSLVEQTINNVNFRVSYYKEGKILKKEIFSELPFTVELDTNHFQTYKVPIILKFLENNLVEVSTSNLPGEVLMPYNEQKVEIENNSIPTKIYSLNEFIEAENFKFKITLLDKSLIGQTEDKVFIVLNTKADLTNYYVGSYEVKPINKQSSIVEVSKESELPSKDIAFLDALCQTYINLGLEEKAAISKNTVKFINVQLNEIQDTLRNIESNLLNFKSENKVVDIGEEGKLIIEKLKEIEGKKSLEQTNYKYYSYLHDYINRNKNFKDIIAPSSMGIADPLLNSLIIKLSELYSQKIVYENSIRDANPQMAQLEQNIKNVNSTGQV
jgi:uncharacterized protein involved in exopolysaccharide biosynthesis